MLRVEQVDSPAVFTDWTYTVPGKYIEDVVSVTATLTTGTGTPAMVDSSGNGFTGTYNPQGAGTVTFGVTPGLVVGDDCVRFTSNAGTDVLGFAPSDLDPSADSFWANLWLDTSTQATAETIFRWADGATSGVDWTRQSTVVPGMELWVLQWGVTLGVDEVQLLVPQISTPTMCSVRVDTANQVVVFFQNGAQTGAAQPFTSPGPATVAGTISFGASFGQTTTFDEVATGSGNFTDVRIGLIYAAASAAFANYEFEQLQAIPNNYYHLDDTTAGGGRQVVLEITDGTRTLEQVPTGFTVAATTGAYVYSWVVALNANSQTPDGSETSVALGRSILTGGYTIGTRTLDLSSADQWSAIAIWWDDTVQRILEPVAPYQYPPGAFLHYQQEAG